MKTTFGLKCLTTTLILCLSITGCKQYGNSFNGNIKHIKFPQEQNLKGERLHYINSIGFYGCDLNYPYLVLSLAKQEAQTAIYDLERKKFMGDYFHIGQGPDDFTSFIIINQNKDSLLGINDVYKRELKIINLYQTIKTKQIVYQQENCNHFQNNLLYSHCLLITEAQYIEENIQCGLYLLDM